MSIPYRELFYNAHGYDAARYFGYDPAFVGGVQITPKPADPPVEKKTDDELVELKAPFCCDGCVEKMQKKLKHMDGVYSVHCDQLMQKVTVKGTAKRDKILKEAKTVLSRTEFWKKK